MFHIICRTLWLNQEVTEEKITLVKPERTINTFKKRLDAEEAKNYLTRIAKRSKLADDIASVSFWVITGSGEPKEIEND